MCLSEEKRNEIAIEISSYWKDNCNDDEFNDNCGNSVLCDIEDYGLSNEEKRKEYEIIMSLIENKYRYDNWEARELFENRDIIFVHGKNVIINDFIFKNVNSIELVNNNVEISDILRIIGFIDFNDIEHIAILD